MLFGLCLLSFIKGCLYIEVGLTLILGISSLKITHTYKGITLIVAFRISTDSSLICFDEVEGYKAPDRPHSSLSENDWSEFSADCDGSGTQTRSRSLHNPGPLDKGADCEKDTKPDQFCHTGHCDGTYNMIYLFFSIFFMAVNQKQLIQLVI